jgi:hypothetical protein
MKKIKTGATKWTNRHEVFTEKIKDLYVLGNEPALDALDGYNDTTKGFQQLIAEAIQTKTPFRALGAGWSWPKIATVNNGVMLDTKPLNTTLSISQQSVLPTYTGDIRKLLFAQCGNGVWELSLELRQKRLSLKTSGASNGQTIVGGMSTGAHGSTFDVGAIQDYVVGMHVIVSPARHVWLERKSAPVVTDFFVKKLGAELLRDDDLFNAALVSFGSFGIIHGVMVEAENVFLIEAYRRRMPYDDVLKGLMSTLDFSNADLPCGNERPFHFSVALNPYDMKKGAFVSTFYKRPYRDDYVRAVPNDAGLGPGDDAPCFIGKITDVIPALVPTIVNKLISSAMAPFEKQLGTLGEIFNNTNLHGKLLSAAIGIPLDKVIQVTDLLFEINKTNGPFAGVFAYRFIKKSNALLAFTHFDFTCILELDGAFSNTTQNFYKAVWKRLDAEGIPYTFHWGKVNEMNFKKIKGMYGADTDKWIAARNRLLDKDSMKVFTNPVLKKWGLDKVL